MGFAGFVTSGVVPAVSGALRGRNERARMAEEQRRYDAAQSQQTAQINWQQEQAREAQRRQAMMDALTREVQMGGLKSQAERNAIDMAQVPRAPQPSESYQEMIGPKGPGMYGITEGQEPRYLGGVIPKPAVGSGTGGGDAPGKTLPTAAADHLFELQSLLRVAKGAASDFAAHPEAFGPFNRLPGVDLIPGTGSQHRLNMGDLTSLIGKARSGGAITPQEFVRLERFLPNAGNLDEKNAAALPRLVQEIESILADRTTYYQQQGYGVPGNTTGPYRATDGTGNRGEQKDARTRAAELKAEGKSREQAMDILRREGYTVE